MALRPEYTYGDNPFSPQRGQINLSPPVYRRRRDSRDGGSSSPEGRGGRNAVRPSYRHIDADATLQARLQRPPEGEPAAFQTARPIYVGQDYEYRENEQHGGDYYEYAPRLRSRTAAPQVNIQSRFQPSRRYSDLLNPVLEHHLHENKDPIADEDFDLELTFQREDTWAPSTIDLENHLSPEPGSPGQEIPEGQATVFNVLTSWAWGYGSNSLNGGELHGFTGSSNNKQSCHFRWS